jgi:hypothetical protein
LYAKPKVALLPNFAGKKQFYCAIVVRAPELMSHVSAKVGVERVFISILALRLIRGLRINSDFGGQEV